MDGDSLKGALFNGSRRLLSGRHVKPKRAFSPDEYASPASKKVVKATATANSGMYDSMARSHLLLQLSSVIPKDFALPAEFLEECVKEADLAIAEASTSAEPSTSAGKNNVSESYDYIIDHSALDNVLSYEKHFMRTTNGASKKRSHDSKRSRKSSITKHSEEVMAEQSVSPTAVLSEVAPVRKSARRRNFSVRTAELTAQRFEVDDTPITETPTVETSSIETPAAETFLMTDTTTAESSIVETPNTETTTADTQTTPIASEGDVAPPETGAALGEDGFTMREDIMISSEEINHAANLVPETAEVNTSRDEVETGENLTEGVTEPFPNFANHNGYIQNCEDETEEMEYELAPSSPEKSVHDELEHDNSMEYEILSIQSPNASPRPLDMAVGETEKSPPPEFTSTDVRLRTPKTSESKDDEDDIKILYEKVPPSTSASSSDNFPINRIPLQKKASNSLSVQENGVYNIRKVLPSRLPDASEWRPNTISRRFSFKKKQFPGKTSIVERVRKNNNRMNTRSKSDFAPVEATATATVTALEPVVLPMCTPNPDMPVKIIIPTTNGVRSARSSRPIINYASLAKGTTATIRTTSSERWTTKTTSSNCSPAPLNQSSARSLRSRGQRFPKKNAAKTNPKSNKALSSGRRLSSLRNGDDGATLQKLLMSPIPNAASVQNASISDRITPSSSRSSSVHNRLHNSTSSLPVENGHTTSDKVENDLNSNDIVVLPTAASDTVSTTSDMPLSVADQFPQLCIKIEDSENIENKILNEITKKGEPIPISNSNNVPKSAVARKVIVPSVSRPQRHRNSRRLDDFVYPSNVKKSGQLRIDTTQPPKVDSPYDEKIIPDSAVGEVKTPKSAPNHRKSATVVKPLFSLAALRKANLKRALSKRKASDANPTPATSESAKPVLKTLRPKISIKVITQSDKIPKTPTHAKTMTRSNAIRSPKSYAVYGFPLETLSSHELSFSERLAVVRALNPMSRGLVNPPDTFTNDFFYREVLSVGDLPNDHERNVVSSSDDDVDVCGEGMNEALRGESLVSSPADECAADVLAVLSLRTIDEEGDGTVPHDQLYEKANRESADVAVHLAAFLRFIFVQRLTDLSTLNTPAGASMFYSMSMANANRLRESLRLYNKKSLLAMVVAHAWLLRNLPVELLAAYLNLLRFLKVAGSNLSRHVIDRCDVPDIQAANLIIGQFLTVKMYDPPTNSIGKLMSGVEPLKNVCLLLVYPQVTPQESNAQLVRPYESLFKNLLPRVVQVAEKVDFRLETRVSDNVEDCARFYVQLIVKHVRDIVKRRPNDHVFLAGWGTSCLLNHQAVALVPGVSGILDFAFPTESAVGPRGEVDDNICLTYCPSLFVVGENSSESSLSNLAHMRKNILVDSGLIVVGAANRNLLVSSLRLNTERISQKCVDRSIVEHVSDFMRIVMEDIGPASNESRELLKPIELPQIYEVDMNALKHGSISLDREMRRAAPLDDAGVQNDDHHYTNKEKPRRKYNKSIDKADRKPRRKKDALNGVKPDLSFLSGPPPGFCTAADSVPVMSNARGESSRSQAFAAPLTSARNSFSNSLKKAVALVGRDTVDPVIHHGMDVSSPAYVKIPTPSMLNKQLPPPMPTVMSVATVSPRAGEKLGNSSAPMAEAPQTKRLLSHQRPPGVHPINVFDGGGNGNSMAKVSPPAFGCYHLSPSSNMPMMSASSRPSFPPKASVLAQPFHVSQDSLVQFVHGVSPAKENDKSEKVEEELIQEEQAAAAALLEQLPDF